MKNRVGELKCPACGYTLAGRHSGDIAAYACSGGCGGVWFDNGEIEAVHDRGETAGELLAGIGQRWASAVDRKRKRACPRCADILMMKRRYGPGHPVEIDECPKCGGIWLDAGELKAIRDSFGSPAEREKADAAMASVISGMVAQAGAAQKRRTKAFHVAAKFLGHMWHDYGLMHFRGREWPPWRGTFRR